MDLEKEFNRLLRELVKWALRKRGVAHLHSYGIVIVVDLPLLRVVVEGSDNPITLDQPCQASLPPD